ncbi:MAG: hypothetical protein U9O50_01915 [Acidobacteriota bacterium]|nr:hypothetical protein [Acidobacteriota bacterium]
MVVSIALLGYGASGSFLAVFNKLILVEKDKFLSVSSMLFSLSIIFSFLVCNAIPFDLIRLTWDHYQIFYIFLYYFVLSLPFLFAGLTVSFAITVASVEVNKIYFSDLSGAGVGAMLSVFIFLPNGDKGVILIISFVALLASFLFSIKQSSTFKGILLFFMLTEIMLFATSPSWLGFRISPFKALPLALHYPNAKSLLTKWNAISRIDVIDSPAVRFAPGLSLLYTKALPSQLGVSVDGEELVAITSFKGPKDPSLEFLSFLPSSLAYLLSQKPEVLLIDPKGGLDILSAFYFDARKIRVIESNPLFVKTLRNELANFSNHLYHKKNISLQIANIRSALKKEKGIFDLIVFPLTEVFGSSGTGLFGFRENYLYTVESFSSILNRLSSEGLISMNFYLLPPPRQELKSITTWVEALEKQDKDPSRHIIALRSWGTISIFIKNSPFEKKDIHILKSFAKKYCFDLVYYPGIIPEEANIWNKFDNPIYFNLITQILYSSPRKEFYKNYLFRISPPSDNRPFFFNFFKLNKIKATYFALGKKWLPFLQGELLIPLLFIQSVMIAILMIGLPLLVFQKKVQKPERKYMRIFGYFCLIGMAYMFIEITLIQKFILFLEHPLYSISVVIFSLLFSSSLGSFFSAYVLKVNLAKNLRFILLICSVVTVSYLLIWPVFSNLFLGSFLYFKFFLTFVFIFPLGFLMGFPFPTGIRLLKNFNKKWISWAWATNAFSSVVNSILALFIAFLGGYNLVWMLGACGYLFASFFLGFSNHGHKANA